MPHESDASCLQAVLVAVVSLVRALDACSDELTQDLQLFGWMDDLIELREDLEGLTDVTVGG